MYKSYYQYGPWIIVKFRNRTNKNKHDWNIFNQYGDGPFFKGSFKECKNVIDINEVPKETFQEKIEMVDKRLKYMNVHDLDGADMYKLLGSTRFKEIVDETNKVVDSLNFK